ncbi:uncharacterized protein BKCO1_5000211 [Diplodia corticola]|uniref:Uncharacterized protein n=1 Tax=Diplodia corticola TaxID=236234 RepID=A0A1J9R8Q6_9PEZI|nr:uncharacterized protein BKCO1_5000211 [Diplodia corticola]OJD37942.1 hypothetical protein BKCO1_5000211 [Diplodia corticola]
MVMILLHPRLWIRSPCSMALELYVCLSAWLRLLELLDVGRSHVLVHGRAVVLGMNAKSIDLAAELTFPTRPNADMTARLGALWGNSQPPDLIHTAESAPLH